MIHQGTLDQSPAMLAQHKAKQERLDRFAQAAVRQENRTRAAADIAQSMALDRSIALKALLVVQAKPEPAPTESKPVAQPYTLPLKIVTIQGAVAREYNLTRQMLMGQDRRASYVLPRQIAFYLCRKLTDLSLPRIGMHFDGRDHTTALHSVNKIARLIKFDTALAAIVRKLEAELAELGTIRTESFTG
jgi:chromosomal replication initiation ATPase DnaA